MGYAIIKGGHKAREESEKINDLFRLAEANAQSLPAEMVEKQMRFAVYKVMSEGSLYAPELAALAIKQAEGDLIEATFIMRSICTTFRRWGYSEPMDTAKMRIIRRTSSSFKDVPGGQYLGPTKDYTLRLLRWQLRHEKADDVTRLLKEWEDISPAEQPAMAKMTDIMRELGFVRPARAAQEEEPYDITIKPIRHLSPTRSAKLQALTRGESGAMVAIAYSALRGYGHVHPNLAELRCGYVEMSIRHPYLDESVCIGEILLTQCDALIVGTLMLDVKEDLTFELGYGACFGQEERKAISMAILDASLRTDSPAHPSESSEFVLYHTDGVDSSSFIDHLKMPHYLLFTAALDRIREVAERRNRRIEGVNSDD
ncbi:MAG TPA: carbon-phosphorus lyase complex subunit PhnI [Negativicutes bacterium]|nr:carbon-phosphorus lyase complex subunit PhnI [Negativicutes bacterium]